LFSTQGASDPLLVFGFQEVIQKTTSFIIIILKGVVKVGGSERLWNLQALINT
jgi:hypothetical protein